MRLILLLRGVESSQEADGIHQGATDMSATKGTFTEVWAGLNETNQGWGGCQELAASGSCDLLGVEEARWGAVSRTECTAAHQEPGEGTEPPPSRQGAG